MESRNQRDREKRKIIFYQIVLEKLSEHHDLPDKTISYNKFKYVLSWYNIPKEKRTDIINEFIELGLVQRINQRGLKIPLPSS